MTFEDIYTEVQDIVDDDSAESLIRIKRWINNAQDVLVSKLPSGAYTALTTSSTGTTVSGTNAYSLPTSYMKILGVYLEIDDTLYDCKYIPIAQFPKVSNANNGQAARNAPYFTITGSTLTFSPDIDDAYPYTIWYAAEPTALTNTTDIPQFPADLHYLLVEYAVSRYFEREQDSQASYHRALFTQGVAEAINFYGQYNQPAFFDTVEIEAEL